MIRQLQSVQCRIPISQDPPILQLARSYLEIQKRKLTLGEKKPVLILRKQNITEASLLPQIRKVTQVAAPVLIKSSLNNDFGRVSSKKRLNCFYSKQQSQRDSSFSSTVRGSQIPLLSSQRTHTKSTSLAQLVPPKNTSFMHKHQSANNCDLLRILTPPQ